MKKKMMLVFVLSLMVFGLGCEYISPGVSRAIMEKKQLENQMTELDLHKREVVALEKIAEMLEKAVEE